MDIPGDVPTDDEDDCHTSASISNATTSISRPRARHSIGGDSQVRSKRHKVRPRPSEIAQSSLKSSNASASTSGTSSVPMQSIINNPEKLFQHLEAVGNAMKSETRAKMEAARAKEQQQKMLQEKDRYQRMQEQLRNGSGSGSANHVGKGKGRATSLQELSLNSSHSASAVRAFTPPNMISSRGQRRSVSSTWSESPTTPALSIDDTPSTTRTNSAQSSRPQSPADSMDMCLNMDVDVDASVTTPMEVDSPMPPPLPPPANIPAKPFKPPQTTSTSPPSVAKVNPSSRNRGIELHPLLVQQER